MRSLTFQRAILALANELGKKLKDLMDDSLGGSPLFIIRKRDRQCPERG